MLAEAVTQATRDQRIRSYFTKRFLEYLRWLDDGSANNLILYYSLRIPAIVLSASGQSVRHDHRRGTGSHNHQGRVWGPASAELMPTALAALREEAPMRHRRSLLGRKP
jgi:hypothetical protein